MTYLNAHQLVKDVQEFSETDEFGIEMKEQAVLDATQLTEKFQNLTEKYFHILFNEIRETFPTDLQEA